MTSTSPQAWLVVLGEVEGLRWVAKNSRMAFSERQCPRASRIEAGDELILYVSRGAYHNPTRDRSQIIGWAVAKTRVTPLRRHLRIGDRSFACACKLAIKHLLSERQGLPFEKLVPKLRFIRRKAVWGHYIRSSLIPLESEDAGILRAEFDRFLAPSRRTPARQPGGPLKRAK